MPIIRAAILATALSLCAGAAAAQNHRLMGESPTDVRCSPRVRVTLDSNAPVAPVSDLQRFFPSRAERLETSGRARVRCQVTLGRATACEILEETPGDLSFGDAASALARRVRFPDTVTTARLTVTYQILAPPRGACRLDEGMW